MLMSELSKGALLYKWAHKAHPQDLAEGETIRTAISERVKVRETHGNLEMSSGKEDEHSGDAQSKAGR